jgi:putative oxidoreductase
MNHRLNIDHPAQVEPKQSSFRSIAEWYLRIGLATAFFSAVADRFGLWGGPGSPNASWGDWQHFLIYANKLNAWMPPLLREPAAWVATIAELVLGFALLIPGITRWAAAGSSVLLTVFALSMAFLLSALAQARSDRTELKQTGSRTAYAPQSG